MALVAVRTFATAGRSRSRPVQTRRCSTPAGRSRRRCSTRCENRSRRKPDSCSDDDNNERDSCRDDDNNERQSIATAHETATDGRTGGPRGVGVRKEACRRHSSAAGVEEVGVNDHCSQSGGEPSTCERDRAGRKQHAKSGAAILPYGSRCAPAAHHLVAGAQHVPPFAGLPTRV